MSAQDHQHGALPHQAGAHQHGGPDHHHAGQGSHDAHHEEPAEETLAPDESPTPLWLPVVGAVLFFVAFIIIAAS